MKNILYSTYITYYISCLVIQCAVYSTQCWMQLAVLFLSGCLVRQKVCRPKTCGAFPLPFLASNSRQGGRGGGGEGVTKNLICFSWECWSRIHERLILLRFLGIILKGLRLEVSVYNVYITKQYQLSNHFCSKGSWGVKSGSRGDCE